MAKKQPKFVKQEYASFADIFPWLRGEVVDEKEYEKRKKKREKMEKAHPCAKSKAWGEKVKLIRDGEKTLGFIIHDPLYFIDSADLDKAQRKAYENWLTGQTRPLIPGVGAASYCSDYNRFHDAYVQGRIATITD